MAFDLGAALQTLQHGFNPKFADWRERQKKSQQDSLYFKAQMDKMARDKEKHDTVMAEQKERQQAIDFLGAMDEVSSLIDGDISQAMEARGILTKRADRIDAEGGDSRHTRAALDKFGAGPYSPDWEERRADLHKLRELTENTAVRMKYIDPPTEPKYLSPLAKLNKDFNSGHIAKADYEAAKQKLTESGDSNKLTFAQQQGLFKDAVNLGSMTEANKFLAPYDAGFKTEEEFTRAQKAYGVDVGGNQGELDIHISNLETMIEEIEEDPTLTGAVGSIRKGAQTTVGILEDLAGKVPVVKDMIAWARDFVADDMADMTDKEKESFGHDSRLSKLRIFENDFAWMLARARQPKGRILAKNYEAAKEDAKLTGLTGSKDVVARMVEVLRQLKQQRGGSSAPSQEVNWDDM